MDNVSQLFVPGEKLTPEAALHNAKRDDLTDVLILGYGPDGRLIIRSSNMTRAEANWMLDVAKKEVMLGAPAVIGGGS